MENIHQAAGAGMQTHNFLNMNLLIDQGSLLAILINNVNCNICFMTNETQIEFLKTIKTHLFLFCTNVISYKIS